MYKKLSLLVLVVGALALVGCGQKFNCKNLAAKNKKCADELAEAMLKSMGAKMPDNMKKQIKEKMKKEFAGDKFEKECEKNMKAPKSDKDKEMKKKIETCFKKSSCKEYAECFAKAMGK